MKRHGIIVRPAGSLGATFNPGVARLADERFAMLVRSVPKGYEKIGAINEFNDRYTSHLSLWEGSSPTCFTLTDAAVLKPDQAFDRFGLEDPRITKIGDTYYIFYTALAIGTSQPDAANGIRIALASTKDFKTFAKHGIVGPDRRCKAGTLFESAGKKYLLWKDEQALERTMLSPVPDDLENPAAWRELWAGRDIERDRLAIAQGAGDEGLRFEPGAPPIAIDEGLLTLYSTISKDSRWSIGLLLLDKNDPAKIIARMDAPFLEPEMDYERTGDVNNVVFPCGALIDRGRLYVYYGGADTVCAVGSESLAKIMKSLKPVSGCPGADFRPST